MSRRERFAKSRLGGIVGSAAWQSLWNFIEGISPLLYILLLVFLIWLKQYYWANLYGVSLLALGYQKVPKAHRALLIIFGYRTKIAVGEGPRWCIPFIMRFYIVDCREKSFDIPKEDCWTKDQVHLMYDIIAQFGVKRLEPPKNFWQWINRFFLWQNGKDLYNYLNVDPRAIMTALRGAAKNTARIEIKKESYQRWFGFEDEKVKVDEEAERLLSNTIKATLEQEAERFGIAIYRTYLQDLDFHEDMAEWMQLKIRKRMEKEATEIAFDILLKVGGKISDSSEGVISPAEGAIKVQILDILKRAADEGIFPLFLQTLAQQKIEELTQPKEKKKSLIVTAS